MIRSVFSRCWLAFMLVLETQDSVFLSRSSLVFLQLVAISITQNVLQNSYIHIIKRCEPSFAKKLLLENLLHARSTNVLFVRKVKIGKSMTCGLRCAGIAQRHIIRNAYLGSL